jgi:hypothetical protein
MRTPLFATLSIVPQVERRGDMMSTTSLPAIVQHVQGLLERREINEMDDSLVIGA